MQRTRTACVLVLCGAAIAGVLAGGASSARTTGSKAVRSTLRDQRGLENAIVAQINRVRSEHGLPQVTRSLQLGAAAREHSDDMARFGYFGHPSHDGTPLQKRLEHFFPVSTYRFWSVGETLLSSATSISGAASVRAWLASPEHRRVLLDPTWRQIGISAVHDSSAPGVYGAREVTVVTADFGTRTH